MPDRKSVRVLVVEPDASTATLLTESLRVRSRDIDVAHVGSLDEALDLLRKQPFDVALLELNLPDAQGLFTLGRLQQERPSLPLVVLTTIADEDLAISAIQQGAQDYLIKEVVHYGSVSRSIRYAIERKRIESELQATKEAALAASAAKSEFLARISHEIQSPLTAIVNYAEILLEPEAPPGERYAAIDSIRRHGLQLLDVVNEVLDIARIETRTFEVQYVECSPTQIVAEVLDMFQMRARAKGLDLAVHWRPGIPVTIITDPVRLKQILVNLVGNAVKFTQRGEVRVDVQPLVNYAAGREPALQIAVTDTGIGISPAQRDKLFLAFTAPSPAATGSAGGAGLGLAISRELARKLGGDISVDSVPGVGSTFRLHIATRPTRWIAAKNGQSATKNGQPAANDSVSGRLLLADDGSDNRRLIATLLRKAGAIVDAVENGQQAVDLALKAVDAGQPYDVILMDLLMPGVDGIAATRQLREAGYAGSIIALTARPASEARDQCLAAGCDDFASKPIARDALIAVVRQWLSKPRPVAAAAIA
jgi:signal transduction histidine kinase